MKYLIKNCKIIQKGSRWNNKRVDIYIERGKIVQIAKNLSIDKAKEITGKNLHCSAGWMDIGTHLGEPGYEQRETMETLAASASAGGYTDLATMPITIPAVQTKGQIQHLKAMGQNLHIDIHPIGALSADLKGENITEFVDMQHHGAVGFSDGLSPIAKSGLLLRALQYTKGIASVILHHPNDHTLSNDDLIHEGVVSTSMGMKGSPSMAESLMLHRDIELQKYTDAQLCVHLISSKESVKLIKSAKKESDKISAGVAYLNLIKTDKDIATFDSSLKVKPILRSTNDKKSLVKGIINGSIDYISSNHVPLEVERKHLEFPYADHGSIGLETCYTAVNTFLGDAIDTAILVEKFTTGPRSIFGLPNPQIEEGEVAKLTLFDPTYEWTYTKDIIKSKSSNTPFIDQEFKGKVIATINQSYLSIAEF